MPEPPQRPPIKSAPLSVVLPTHNAAAELAQVVADWTAYLDTLGRDYDILLVDDGSTDDTGRLADELSRSNPRLRVLTHPARQGYGAALRTGLAAAHHPLLCTATGDRQYRPADLQRLLDMIDQVDVATGYRLVAPPPAWLRGLHGAYRGFMRVVFGATPPPLPSWPGWGGWGRRCLARRVFGVCLLDPVCAFRLFRRTLFERMPIQSDGAFALVEVMAKANFLGALIAEEPVSYTRPADAGAAVDSPAGERLGKAARRLFRAPDFGPVRVAEPPPLACERPSC
jgi:glycosyltransferase involved in cell wall biosynthesis